MASFSIEKFKSAIGTPARSHLFRCTVTPAAAGLLPYFNADASFLCKAVTLPSATVETTELSYFSRAVKIPSRRTYAPITLTFYLSEDYKLRAGFEQWSNALNAYDENQRGTLPFYGTITLVHYSSVATSPDAAKNEDANIPTLATYTLQSAFPTTVSGLQFSYDNDAEIQTFDVEFQYQYLTITLDGRTIYPEKLQNAAVVTEPTLEDYLKSLKAQLDQKSLNDKGEYNDATWLQTIKDKVVEQEEQRILAGGKPFGKTTGEITQETLSNLISNAILAILNRT